MKPIKSFIAFLLVLCLIGNALPPADAADRPARGETVQALFQEEAVSQDLLVSERPPIMKTDTPLAAGLVRMSDSARKTNASNGTGQLPSRQAPHAEPQLSKSPPIEISDNYSITPGRFIWSDQEKKLYLVLDFKPQERSSDVTWMDIYEGRLRSRGKYQIFANEHYFVEGVKRTLPKPKFLSDIKEHAILRKTASNTSVYGMITHVRPQDHEVYVRWLTPVPTFQTYSVEAFLDAPDIETIAPPSAIEMSAVPGAGILNPHKERQAVIAARDISSAA